VDGVKVFLEAFAGQNGHAWPEPYVPAKAAKRKATYHGLMVLH